MSKHLEPDGTVATAHSPRSWRHWMPYAFLAAMLVFATVCGVVAARMMQTKQSFADSAVSFFVPPPDKVFGKDRIYVMLLGIDYNYDEKDQEYSTGARSDTIMVAGLDFPTKAVKVVSVPRDALALVHGREDKINGAYAAGGVKYSDQVIGSFLGFPEIAPRSYFDRYIVLKINATKDLIDAIGGIDVPVTETMDYDDNWGHLHIHFKPGLTHMNGEQAVGYSRFRHDACSDPCRIKRQQQVLQLTIGKLKADKINDLAHIGQLIGIINRNVITNLTDDEKKSLAWHFKDINLADLKTDQLKYVDTKNTVNGEVLVMDDKQKAQVLADITGPYAKATPPPATVIAAVVPANVHVAVENGSGQGGLGKKMADALHKRGYVVDSIGNADAFTYDTTVIREHSKTAGVGERVRADLALKSAAVSPVAATPAGSTTAVPSGDVTVIVGKDFAAALASQPPKAASPQ